MLERGGAERNGSLPQPLFRAGVPARSAETGGGGDGGGGGTSSSRLESGDTADGASGTLGRRNPAFSAGEEQDTEAEWVMIVQPPAKVAEQPAHAQFATKL